MSAVDQVFVSYSRRNQAWVDEFADALESAGIPTWIDRRSIPVSVPWLQELEHAIVTSALFLVCRSEQWESSRHCAAEAETAQVLRKEHVEVTVGEDIADATERVAAALRGISAPARAHTNLQARAYQWDEQGRPLPLLPNLRERRRLERTVGSDRISTVVERDFLDASRARTRRWRRAATWVAALPVVPLVLTGALQLLQDLGSVQAFAVTTVDTVLERTERSPYVGLQMASGLGFMETWLHAEALHMALNRPIPDDRVVVDGPVTGFATPVLDDVVALTADDGNTWVRSLDVDVRPATVADGPPRDGGSAGAVHDLRVEIVTGTARVTVDRGGQRYRTLMAERPVSAAAISPDGRTVAVAAHRVVHLFDVELGRRRGDLRGLPAEAVDLAFTRDGSQLFAAIDDGAVGWTIRHGTRLLDEPGQRYEAVLRSDRDDRVWLVDRTRGLRLIDTTTGEETRRIELEDDAYGATADPQGRVAAVHLLDRIGIVDLATGATRTVAVDDCSIATPVVSPDATQVLTPCRQGPLVVVAAVDGHELDRLPPPASGVTAVGIAADTGELYLGSQDGVIHGPVDGDGSAWQLRCRSEVVAIAVADDGGLTVPAGIGTGGTGCSSRRIVNAEGDASWHSFADVSRTATMARAAAIVSDRDAFAIGYDDGTVRLRPAVNLEPHHRFDEVHGTVTGLLARPATQELLVATRAGVLHVLTTAGIPLTNADAAVEAQVRLERARELGLTELVSYEEVEAPVE